ncbi:MAG: hypothetical protein Q7T86_13125 [Hyphomicrobiaceae bacterium]|nr:hypothetical protein [Hyphomicrobiaceae bacterium]
MPHKLGILAAGVAAVAISVPSLASALTLTNKDKAEHTVGIDYGAKEEVQTVAAGASVTIKDCDAGCGVTGPWNYSRMLKTGDKVDFDGTSPVQKQ